MNSVCSRIRKVESLVWQKPGSKGQVAREPETPTLDVSLGKLKTASGMLAPLKLEFSSHHY